MKNFLTSLVCIILLASCTNPITKGLKEVDSSSSVYTNTLFSDIQTDYVYKAKIKAFEANFGGILIIKKIKDDNHRIVFTTEFGNKIFDFEIIDQTFKTHFILKELNRKIIINTLKRDFETLTNETNTVSNSYDNDKNTIIQSKFHGRLNHYFIHHKTQNLEQIVQTKNSKVKTIIVFDDIEDSIAKIINIEHKSLPLSINLSFFRSN